MPKTSPTTPPGTRRTAKDNEWLDAQSPSVHKVLAALIANPDSCAADLATAAAVTRSTATKALTTLEAAGHAERTSTDTSQDASARRAPDTWRHRSGSTRRTPTRSTKSSTRSGTSIASTPGGKSARPAHQSGHEKPSSRTATKTAARASSTSKPASTPLTKATKPTGSSVSAPPTPKASKTSAASVAVSASVSNPTGKLHKGQLTALVMDHLHADPAREWSVRELWRTLQRSQGAISNALERAVDKGTVIRTSHAPRRYRLAQATVPKQRRKTNVQAKPQTDPAPDTADEGTASEVTAADGTAAEGVGELVTAGITAPASSHPKAS